MGCIKEVVFNLEQRNYSYNELKGILNHSDRNISHIFKSRGIVSQIKEKCRITGNLCMHFSYEQINHSFISDRFEISLFSIILKISCIAVFIIFIF